MRRLFFILGPLFVLGCPNSNETSVPDAGTETGQASPTADAGSKDMQSTQDAGTETSQTSPAADAGAADLHPSQDAGTSLQCDPVTADVLADTAWGLDAHGHQRFRFHTMAPDVASLAIGTYATSHFTLEFEEDGFDFAYFIECQYAEGDYALIIADYYSAWVDGWDPSAGVQPEDIVYRYATFSIGPESTNDAGEADECLFMTQPWSWSSAEERDASRLSTERTCWPRTD